MDPEVEGLRTLSCEIKLFVAPYSFNPVYQIIKIHIFVFFKLLNVTLVSLSILHDG